jgi:hypothetical protein
MWRSSRRFVLTGCHSLEPCPHCKIFHLKYTNNETTLSHF